MVSNRARQYTVRCPELDGHGVCEKIAKKSFEPHKLRRRATYYSAAVAWPILGWRRNSAAPGSSAGSKTHVIDGRYNLNIQIQQIFIRSET